MGRRSRIHFSGAVYHVMARGVNGCPIYLDEADRKIFLEALRRTADASGADITAYCLMGNHFHLAIKVGLVPLSCIMQRLLTSYSQRFNLRYQRTGHLFQARYKAVLCTDDQYLLTVIRYIHQNPVRAGLVDEAIDWPWSSVRQFPELSGDLLADFNPWPNDTRPAPTLLRSLDEVPPIEALGTEIANLLGISISKIRTRSKSREIVGAKRMVARKAVKAGYSMTETADWLGVAQHTISRYCGLESDIGWPDTN